MEKLIITAAICGAEVTKEHNPAVPYTVEELVREAVSAYDAGAAIVHVHVREDDGTPTQSKERFRVCMEAIKASRPDVILLPSTGGAVGMTATPSPSCSSRAHRRNEKEEGFMEFTAMLRLPCPSASRQILVKFGEAFWRADVAPVPRVIFAGNGTGCNPGIEKRPQFHDCPGRYAGKKIRREYARPGVGERLPGQCPGEADLRAIKAKIPAGMLRRIINQDEVRMLLAECKRPAEIPVTPDIAVNHEERRIAK